ncbi:MAG: SDR family NAD(P)-dependent oxidoreductase [Bdellovibrionales bacterium]|nr:SDR family NAD(P)-dependent oxidoreductase [Bdellovibrionales bacterium]
MILITGASSGIGEACARAFARTGRDLFLVARREDRLKDLAQELQTQFGVRVVYEATDVRSTEMLHSLSVTRAQDLSKVSVLINNAGLARGLEAFQDSNESDWQEMIGTNLTAVLGFTQLLLPFFLKKNSGHIVMMGSVAARWLYPRGHVYSATKAAVHALAESLRLDLLGTKIRVTTIAPGMVETEFSEVRFRGDTARAAAVYSNMQPLRAEDVAEAVVWATLRPAHVNIQEIVMYPVDQASPTQVARSSKKE